MIEDECTLPNFIYVGPHKYFVETSKSALMEKMVEQKTSGLMGHVSTGQATIYINTDYAPTQQRDTLLHEVLHAIVYDTALHLDWDSVREEEVVSRLTPAILNVLRRNPELVECLMENLDV